jgi:uncharacterized BrkB/YihY/UPF0761 family membrane protein
MNWKRFFKLSPGRLIVTFVLFVILLILCLVFGFGSEVLCEEGQWHEGCGYNEPIINLEFLGLGGVAVLSLVLAYLITCTLYYLAEKRKINPTPRDSVKKE